MATETVNDWELITNNNMNIFILFGLIFTGIFIKLFLANNSSSNSGQASSAIWGYGLTAIALFTLMFIVLSKDLNLDANPTELIFSTGAPIFALIIVLVYIIFLNLNYFTKLNNNYVPAEYSLYSNISSTLIIVQVILLYQFSSMLLNNKKKTELLKNIMNVTWIFSGLNLILVIIMNIILKFFTTDG